MLRRPVEFAEFCRRCPDATRLVLTLAIGIAAVVLTLHLDFERLNQALFTDYDPAGSAVRHEGNTFFRFLINDALWVAAYAFFSGARTSPRMLAAVMVLPVGILAYSMFSFNSSGSSFDLGYSSYAETRGNQQLFIYTQGTWDEPAARAWIEQSNTLMPWDSSNAEHLAIHFTNSVQAIKWGRVLEDPDAIVDTLCIYELDQSSSGHPGYYDCFTGHLTFTEKLQRSIEETDTGLGDEVDDWYADARLCEGIPIPQRATEIALHGFCVGVQRRYEDKFAAIAARYGRDSAQVEFLLNHRHLLWLD